MNKQAVLLFCLVWAVKAHGMAVEDNQLSDIIDEAKQQLEELKRIVQGDVLAAHDELQNSLTSFLTFANNIVEEGGVAIQQEHETIFAQITTVKELALTAGKDISICTKGQEQVLHELAKNYTQEMLYCVSGKEKAAGKITEDAILIIDSSTDKVQDFEHQLHLCGDSILCITPVVNEIQLDMVRLPENIKTEVESSRNLLNILKLSIQECANVKAAEYSSEANSVLSEIVTCANGIIG